MNWLGFSLTGFGIVGPMGLSWKGAPSILPSQQLFCCTFRDLCCGLFLLGGLDRPSGNHGSRRALGTGCDVPGLLCFFEPWPGRHDSSCTHRSTRLSPWS